MRVRLHPERRSVKVKARRYSPDQHGFLVACVNALKDMSFFIDMPTAEWQAAPLLVPNRNSRAKFRMTVDLRPVNAATIKEAWPMPNLESEINDFKGSTCYASLDFVSGYWQMPLHPGSYSSCGVITPKGVVASTRVLPGLENACAYFQRTVELLFSSLRDNMKAWLDDFSLYAKCEGLLLRKLKEFFQCKEKKLSLSAKKCVLFTDEHKRCGRIVSD